ncbi:hypothetical protein [Streptomyces sp. NPDC001340]
MVALDPVLEAGTRTTLLACPGLAVCEPGDARVAVLTVDRLGPAELDMVRTTRAHPNRPAVVLVAGALASGDALHALAAGARGLLLRREADSARLAHAVLAAARDDCTLPPTCSNRSSTGRDRPGTRRAAGPAAPCRGASARSCNWSPTGTRRRRSPSASPTPRAR